MQLESGSFAVSSQLRICVLVAGVHRSGTSATARVINLLGADIARDLMPAVPNDNDRGFWESLAIVDIHEQLLRDLGTSWDDPFPLRYGWTETSAAQEAKRRLIGEIDREFARSQLFVVKDPRISRLLDLWIEVLDELGIEPIVVIPFRNPLEVAASLKKQHGIPRAKSLLLYLRGNLDAELASRRQWRIFVRYDELIGDWGAFAQKLAGMMNLPPRSHSAESTAEIDGFLTPDLHRIRFKQEQLLADPNLAPSVIEVYQRLSAAAATGDETQLRPSFDRLRGVLDEATRLYRNMVVAQMEPDQGRVVHAPVERVDLASAATAKDGDVPSNDPSAAKDEEGSQQPYFVRDYRALNADLASRHSRDEAMDLGVGGGGKKIGQLEFALLQQLGLKSHHFLIDVGCGSGRLSAALAADMPDVNYLGIDVVNEFIKYARQHSPAHFRFSLVEGLYIPEQDGVADFVAFFSVMTHLHHHESYIYLKEAKRVLKSGGRVVISFLEVLNRLHWPVFQDTAQQAVDGKLAVLNAFIETPVIEHWASRLGLVVEQMFHGGANPMMIEKPIIVAGEKIEGSIELGQSVAVLRKH